MDVVWGHKGEGGIVEGVKRGSCGKCEESEGREG